jgi:hypothetical protein
MRRGQATVELALGSMVFITILLFGIHFAEFGWLSLKVQEAQTWAMWEATGRRVQQLPNGAGNTVGFDNTLAALGPTATREYRDFDGRSGVNRGGVIVAALTRAENMTVECQEERGLSGAAGNGNWRPSATVRPIYSDRGGISCLAKADLEGFRIPTKLLENSANGFFKAANRKPNPYTFCGIGPSSAGACTGRIAILTNDWGLAGDGEKGQQPAPVSGGGAAADYADAVQQIWTPDGMAGANLANAFAGDAPVDANEFWFSYAGIEVGHLSPVSGHGPAGPWNTGSPGIGIVPNGSETRCFLGKDHTAGGPCD